MSSLSCQLKCEIQLAVPDFVAWDLAIYTIIVLVGFTCKRHIIYSCDSDLCFVPETHYFNLLPMNRRHVLLSDAWSVVEKNPEGATPKRSQRTINCNTTCSIGKILHNKKQHVYMWLKSLMRQWTSTVLHCNSK